MKIENRIFFASLVLVGSLVAAYLLSGCGTVKNMTSPAPTVFTDNNSTPEDTTDDQIITVQMKLDAHLTYKKTKDGYTLEIDNKGSRSFTRAVAERIVEKTELVLAPGLDSVGGKD